MHPLLSVFFVQKYNVMTGERVSRKFMLPEMLKEIRLRGGTEDQVSAYLIEWNKAIANQAIPIPCPLCFLKGHIQPLIPIRKGGEDLVRCMRCREFFVYDAPI